MFFLVAISVYFICYLALSVLGFSSTGGMSINDDDEMADETASVEILNRLKLSDLEDGMIDFLNF